MNLKFIKLNGFFQSENIENVLNFLEQNPGTEICLDVNVENCCATGPCYTWLQSFYQASLNRSKSYSLTLNLQGKWADDFCNGHISRVIEKFLDLMVSQDVPFISKVSVNLIGKADADIKPDDIIQEMMRYPHQLFILQGNMKKENLLEAHAQKNCRFDYLCEGSCGQEILTEAMGHPHWHHSLLGFVCQTNDDVPEKFNHFLNTLPKGARYFIEMKSNAQENVLADFQKALATMS